MFDEKQVTTILLANLEKILVNPSFTSFSDCDLPGTLALVESPIRASRPLFPICSNLSLRHIVSSFLH